MHRTVSIATKTILQYSSAYWSVQSAAKAFLNVTQTKQAEHDCSQLDAAIVKVFGSLVTVS